MTRDNRAKGEKQLAWPTVERLSEYLIILEEYIESSKDVISSSELAGIYSNTPSQVRQDIFRLKDTGRVGQGYNVHQLADSIRRELGLDVKKGIAIIGCGKIGTTLAEHIPFGSYGMYMTALFDKDPSIIGTDIAGIKVKDIAELEDFMKNGNTELVGLCVPAEVAQDVADRLAGSGVKGILNYTRKRLKVPEEIYVQHSQMICSFMQLAYMSGKHSPPAS